VTLVVVEAAVVVVGAAVVVVGAVEGVAAVADVVPDCSQAARLWDVTTAPFVVVSNEKLLASGWWMFAAARPTSPLWCAVRKPTAWGGGITMPMFAASCSIR